MSRMPTTPQRTCRQKSVDQHDRTKHDNSGHIGHIQQHLEGGASRLQLTGHRRDQTDQHQTGGQNAGGFAIAGFNDVSQRDALEPGRHLPDTIAQQNIAEPRSRRGRQRARDEGITDGTQRTDSSQIGTAAHLCGGEGEADSRCAQLVLREEIVAAIAGDLTACKDADPQHRDEIDDNNDEILCDHAHFSYSFRCAVSVTCLFWRRTGWPK